MSYQPAQRPSMTASTRRNRHEQPSHPFFDQAFAATQTNEPYRSMRDELATQLYDETATFGGTGYSHSNRVIDSMRRLSTTAQKYERDDHVKRNMAKWLNVFDCIGSAEQKTHKLLGSLPDLRLPAPRNARDSTSTSRRSVARSMTVPVYASSYQNVDNSAVAQFTAAPLNTYAASSPYAVSPPFIPSSGTDKRGYVIGRETMNPNPSDMRTVMRTERAQLIDNLVDTTPYLTAADLGKDREVLGLCAEVKRLAKQGIATLEDMNSDFHETSGVWEKVASNLSKSTNTLYGMMSATATVVGGIVDGMDSGPNKIALGGIGGSIQAAAQYLQRKIQDPASTQNTASNARAAAEDLRHNTQMVLMAYIELQGVIVKILRMREGGSTFSEEEKKRIAQFFYSFGRHFDTIPGTSIQHTGEVETRWLKEPEVDHARLPRGRSTDELYGQDFFPEFDHVAQLAITASNIEGHCRSLAYLLWYAHGETQLIDPLRDAMRSVANYLELLKEAISALENIFRAIQHIILAPLEAPNEALSDLSTTYRSAMTALKRIGAMAEITLETLSKSGRDAFISISYPPVIHFLLVEVIGSEWNDRLYALAKLSYFVQRVKDDVDSIASASVHLQLSVEGLQERFSVAKMLEYRDLGPEQQWQLKQFLSRTWIALREWADHIAFCGEVIRSYDTAMLEIPVPGAHNRPK
ncbi:uncharacterized protein SCHCODRAFT_02602558 [Schizophyllum commune H4-8]|uniref:uncharacterized protein n=1 Tax=Schizophyllum commune (strain H4-8 / FGSC 9210) TaxID=578458 RepID=UPI0021603829|nr:uncharacterized protein SCHCODRAFT_02602558 [Schizophyllum commune H4-8]KAI5888072.1 hypothetical protein SCHCODRAFT_02602558 [Schizophyllum commune H4-8]